MKVVALMMVAILLGATVGFCSESNPLAIGAEKITTAPFDMLKGGNEHLFSPVKDIDAAALDFTDNARAAAISVGMNLGRPVEE